MNNLGEIVTNGIVTDVESGINKMKSFYFGKLQVNTAIEIGKTGSGVPKIYNDVQIV